MGSPDGDGVSGPEWCVGDNGNAQGNGASHQWDFFGAGESCGLLNGDGVSLLDALHTGTGTWS